MCSQSAGKHHFDPEKVANCRRVYTVHVIGVFFVSISMTDQGSEYRVISQPRSMSNSIVVILGFHFDSTVNPVSSDGDLGPHSPTKVQSYGPIRLLWTPLNLISSTYYQSL